MLDALRNAIEAKFQALANDGRAFVDKVEEIVGLGNAAKELADIEAKISTIVGAADQSVEQKVEAILHAVGKL